MAALRCALPPSAFSALPHLAMVASSVGCEEEREKTSGTSKLGKRHMPRCDRQKIISLVEIASEASLKASIDLLA
jgi:hypothetical protein